VTNTNNHGFIAGSGMRQVDAVHWQASTQPAPSVVRYITRTAAIAPCSFVALFRWRRKPPAVKLTYYTGGAHVFTRQASRAPVHPAYLRRSPHQGKLCR
jgi:hypothetical protein